MATGHPQDPFDDGLDSALQRESALSTFALDALGSSSLVHLVEVAVELVIRELGWSSAAVFRRARESGVMSELARAVQAPEPEQGGAHAAAQEPWAPRRTLITRAIRSYEPVVEMTLEDSRGPFSSEDNEHSELAVAIRTP